MRCVMPVRSVNGMLPLAFYVKPVGGLSRRSRCPASYVPQLVDERGSSQVLQAPPPSSRDLRVGGPALGEVKHTAGLQAQAQALYQACKAFPCASALLRNVSLPCS